MNSNQVYTEEYCKQLELAYGKDMMSEGGLEEIDFMFMGIKANNKKILDFGSGLGGATYYLADRYNANVTGLEINQVAIDNANKNVPSYIRDKVKFVLSTGDKLPFPDASFDIIFSRGVIVHLTMEQRKKLFVEFHRILTKPGQLIIHDWLSPHDNEWSDKIHHIIENEGLPLYAESPRTYTELLSQANFKEIKIVDRAAEYAKYNKDIAEKLDKLGKADPNFAKQFGIETLQRHIADYLDIAAASEAGELLNMFITASV